MKRRRLMAGLAALALPCAALAQAAASWPDACPKAAEVMQRHLLGLWHAEFEGLPRGATLLLEPHPELQESVHGEVNRNGERTRVTGDVDEGEFTLEESHNGTNISAVWLGEVVEGSCGREIRGTWKAEGDPRHWPFVLRKR